MENLESESAKTILENILVDTGFVRTITHQTVTSLTEKGFNIGGHFLGARFSAEKGLTVWSKSKRSISKKFTVSQLSELEDKLIEAFNEIKVMRTQPNHFRCSRTHLDSHHIS